MEAVTIKSRLANLTKLPAAEQTRVKREVIQGLMKTPRGRVALMCSLSLSIQELLQRLHQCGSDPAGSVAAVDTAKILAGKVKFAEAILSKCDGQEDGHVVGTHFPFNTDNYRGSIDDVRARVRGMKPYPWASGIMSMILESQES